MSTHLSARVNFARKLARNMVFQAVLPTRCLQVQLLSLNQAAVFCLRGLHYQTMVRGKVGIQQPFYLPNKSVLKHSTAQSPNECKRHKSDISAGKGKLVYKPSTNSLVRAVKLFSLSTSGAGLAIAPWVLYKSSSATTIAMKLTYSSIFGFFIFATPVLIHLVTKRYITDIHYNPETEKFTLARYSIFLRRKEVEYTPDDVTRPDFPGAFTSMYVKGKPYILYEQLFKDMEVYVKMMKLDEPLDWELPSEDAFSDDEDEPMEKKRMKK